MMVPGKRERPYNNNKIMCPDLERSMNRHILHRCTFMHMDSVGRRRRARTHCTKVLHVVPLRRINMRIRRDPSNRESSKATCRIFSKKKKKTTCPMKRSGGSTSCGSGGRRVHARRPNRGGACMHGRPDMIDRWGESGEVLAGAFLQLPS